MSNKSLMNSLLNRDVTEPDMFGSLQKEIDSVFNRFRNLDPFATRDWWPSDGKGQAIMPKMDLSETDTAIEVEVELPGVERKDVDVQVVNELLVIDGHKESKSETKDKNRHVVERSSGRFRRQIPLGFDVDPEKVQADFRNGVLSIVIEKPPEAMEKIKKIPVKESSEA